MSDAKPTLSAACLAEALGTFILVFFGCGAVHAAVLTSAQAGLWQVAIVWGLGVTLAVMVVGGVSGGHINPAITIALALWGKFPPARALPYVLAQLAGAFAAAALLFALYEPFAAAKEREKQVTRGGPGSEITAMVYGEYYPNPGPLAAASGRYDSAYASTYMAQVTMLRALLAEMAGTALLALVVVAVTDPRNSAAPPARLAPAFIGLTVAALISVLAPLTQACLNPARDFGPRLFAALAGWGSVAFAPGWPVLVVYLAGPISGAIIGVGIYQWLVGPALVKMDVHHD